MRECRRSLLRWEFRRLAMIQKKRRKTPALRMSLRLVSPHMLYDISAGIWLAFIAALPYGGYRFLWTTVVNLIMSWAINAALGWRYPSQIEPRLKAYGQVSPSGMPPVDLWMMVCVFWQIHSFVGNPLVSWFCLAFCSVLLFSKVVACTYFFHQVAASLVCGPVSTWAALSIGRRYFRRVPYHVNSGFFVVVVLLILAYVGYRAERNEAPVFRVRKSECKDASLSVHLLAVLCNFFP